mmetsp:Transcript_3955/g.6777  ORF Transcript_3955/g.6777 Transcript_3955/m.6777 type:complete len:300 (+) Transcript_3955:499-1398(+)
MLAKQRLPGLLHRIAVDLTLVGYVAVVPRGVKVDDQPRSLGPVHGRQVAFQPRVLRRPDAPVVVAADVDDMGAADIEGEPHVGLPAIVVEATAAVLAVWHILKPVSVRSERDPVRRIRLDLVVARQRKHWNVIQVVLKHSTPRVPPGVVVVGVAEVAHDKKRRNLVLLCRHVLHRLNRVYRLPQISHQSKLERLLWVATKSRSQRRNANSSRHATCCVLFATERWSIFDRAVRLLYVEQYVVEERGLVVAAILRGVVHVRRGDGVGETAVFLGVAGQAPIHSSAVRKRGGSKAHNNTSR